jgi:hypothetical protein
MPHNVPDDFITGVEYVAHEHGLVLQLARLTDDGYLEVTLVDEHDQEIEYSVDIRIVDEEFKNRKLMEVRVPATDTASSYNYYISPIPFVLFGAIFCET